ncbi:MAG: 3-phosphoshikimate 1-carboxyvinyltransferase, partial [Syntrophales bacterium]|nr:3-phosphoshikimate 1-carboxyvinyltransferase [Syntrophales bacterium]
MIASLAVSPLEKTAVKVTVPGSKSYTQRALVLAALAEGTSVITNALIAQDTEYLIGALTALGAIVARKGTELIVTGTSGRPCCPDGELYLGNNGTATRFLLAVAALGRGCFRFDGDERLRERPVGPLLTALEDQGAVVVFDGRPGCLPLTLQGRGLRGGRVEIEGRESSQYVSALLISAPYAAEATEIVIRGSLSSRPYVDMTLGVMEAFGITPRRERGRFCVPAGRGYRAVRYNVEADFSSASYFLALAPLCGINVTVENISRTSQQGDAGFLSLLAALGCGVQQVPEGVVVTGGRMVGGDMTDLVPTLAVIAACRPGKTVITGVPHLRLKESDRLAALARELTKTGIRVDEHPDGLTIHGGRPCGAEIETYNDHRIAMSFAVLGKAVGGMVIKNPRCVAKSFPTF